MLSVVNPTALFSGVLLLLAVACATSSGREPKVQGFGARTVGGQGGEVFWVDPILGDPSEDDHAGTQDDPCSLRKALAGGRRIIRFTRGGTITLHGDITMADSYVTIDGASAPPPGVTITHTHEHHGGLVIRTSGRDVHDILLRHLRFAGLWDEHPRHKVGWRILNVSADGRGGQKAYNIVFDHLTMHGLQDKTTLWGAVQNVTVSWCFFYDSYMATLASFYGRPFDLRRKGITFHHNLYARSEQRNPQLRGWIEDFEYVNNIVYGWTNYGMRIKNQPGEKAVHANIINNIFSPGRRRPQAALIYGWDPGPDYADRAGESGFVQGTVYTDNEMGHLYVAGNTLPPENRDQYSTIPQPLAIPEWARVTTCPAEELPDRLLPEVGMKYRSEAEKKLIAHVAQALKAHR